MRQRLHAIAFALVTMTLLHESAARADTKSHEAAVKDFFKAAQMDQLINSTLEQMTDMQVRANPQMAQYRNTLLAFFKKYMSWESLEPEITSLYVKEFTENEIKEITKFYQTEVGRKVMKKLPELSAKAAAIGQARVQQHVGELTSMLEKDGKGGAPSASPKAPEAAPKKP